MANKTENGKQFSASAYLVVPDADKPSTWKLRVEEEPGKITVPQLGRAAAALGPGFRGKKAKLSEDERSGALKKLRALYKKHGGDDAKMPTVMQNAMSSDAIKKMRRMKKDDMPDDMKAMAEMSMMPDGQGDKEHEGDKEHDAMKKKAKKMMAEAVVNFAEAYQSIDFVSSMLDGDLSFEAVRAAVCCARDSYHTAMHGEHGMNHPWDCTVKLTSTFPGIAVFEMKSKLYQIAYEMDGTSAKFTGEPTEIVFAPEDVPASSMSEHRDLAEERDLLEADADGHQKPCAMLSEASLNRDTRVIEGCVVMNAVSANGPKGRRVYSENALRQISKLAEGAPAYANHVKDKSEAFKPRPVQELIGKHRNVRFDASKQRVVSDLHLVEHHAPWVFGLADTMGDVVGNSPVTRGVVRMEGDNEIVDDIVALRSIDLVSDPATTRGLFEHREDWRRNQHTREGEAMTRKELLEAYAKLDKDDQKVVVETIAADVIKVKDTQIASLAEAKTKAETDLVTTKKTLTEATSRLEVFEADKAKAAKAAKLDQVLAESDLGKKYVKHPKAVTDRFKAQLLDLDEKEWSALIEDRVEAIGTSASAPPVRSGGKDATLTEHREGDEKPAHERVLTALRGGRA